MATLKEPVKIFIVQSLACFDTPQQVVDDVRQEFGIEIERQQVASYDPTKATCRNMSKKLGGVLKSMLTLNEAIIDVKEG